MLPLAVLHWPIVGSKGQRGKEDQNGDRWEKKSEKEPQWNFTLRLKPEWEKMECSRVKTALYSVFMWCWNRAVRAVWHPVWQSRAEWGGVAEECGKEVLRRKDKHAETQQWKFLLSHFLLKTVNNINFVKINSINLKSWYFKQFSVNLISSEITEGDIHFHNYPSNTSLSILQYNINITDIVI